MELVTIALPKGRLMNDIANYVSNKGISIKEDSRKLDFLDHTNNYRFLFVKNSDVPVYVNYGVADIGIVGSDVIYEEDFDFLRLGVLPFGSTRICVAGYEKDRKLYEDLYSSFNILKDIKIATKFIKFTKDYFALKGIPVKIIKLTGSVELAPILQLSNFIVDLVETGTTLRENNLVVIDEIGKTQVEIIGNPSLYKLKFKRIDNFIKALTE